MSLSSRLKRLEDSSTAGAGEPDIPYGFGWEYVRDVLEPDPETATDAHVECELVRRGLGTLG